MLINWTKLIIYYNYDLKIMMSISPRNVFQTYIHRTIILSRHRKLKTTCSNFDLDKSRFLKSNQLINLEGEKAILISKKDVGIALNDIEKNPSV